MANIQDIADITLSQTNDDVSETFIANIEKKPLLMHFGIGSATHGAQSEFKWPEENRAERTATLDVDYVIGTCTVVAGDGLKFQVGDQFHIDGHVDGSFVRITLRVDSIATDVLSVTAVNGTDVGLTSTSQTIFINKSYADSSGAITDTAAEPDMIISFLQLIRGKGLKLGRKLIRESQNGVLQGIDDIVTRGLEQAQADLQWQLYEAIVRSFGVKETSSTIPAKTRGLLEFINTASDVNRINGSAGALTEDLLNDLMEKLTLRGMHDNERKIFLVSPATARKISALRSDKVTYAVDAASFGQAVQQYHSEIPGVGPSTIVVDQNQPNGLLLLISPDWVDMVPATNRTLVELEEINKDAGTYGREWSLTAELGLKVMYALRYHGVIYNFT